MSDERSGTPGPGCLRRRGAGRASASARRLALLALWLAVLACGSATSLPTSAPPTPNVNPATGTTSGLWYLTRGGSRLDQGWGVDVDSAGNVYFGTHQQAESELFTDMVIYKFAADGTQLWETHWGGPFQEKLFVVTVAEPLVYVAGLTQSSIDPTQADMAVLALNVVDGSIAWEFTWGQGFGYEEVDGLVVDGDSVYVSGWTTGEATGNDVAILRLDLQGNLVWVQTWGTPGWDQADGQMVVDGDTIYVCGRYNAPNMALGGDAFVARFSRETGEYLSHVIWGGALFDDALGMTSDGTFLYAVGLTLSRGDGGQIFVLKLDRDLNLLWDEVWGGPAGESARVVAVDDVGHVLITGHSDSYGSGANDIVLLQYSPDGQLLWSQVWGGPQSEGTQGIVIDGSVAYLAGVTASVGSGQQDAVLIRVDSQTGQFPPLTP